MAKTLTNREKRIAWITGTAMVLFVLFRVGIAPGLRRYRVFTARQTHLEREYLEAQRNLRIRARVERERDAYAREISKQGSDRMEQSFLLRELERLSRALPIRVRGMRPLPPEDMGSYKRYAVSLDAEGAVGDILKFLHAVESSASLLKVEYMHLNVVRGEQQQLEARFRISRPSVGSTSAGASSEKRT